MSAKAHVVRLSSEERTSLECAARSYRRAARERTRARILLLADTAQKGGSRSDAAIAVALRSSRSTVARVRMRYAEGGLERALVHKEQGRRKVRVLDGEAEAHLVALVCSAPPEGYKRWSLRLLKDTMMECRYADAVSHETVRRVLKKKPAQAVAEETLVHSAEAERGVRLPHGGRAGCLPPALGSLASAGLPGRGQPATARRCPRSAADGAGHTGALR